MNRIFTRTTSMCVIATLAFFLPLSLSAQNMAQYSFNSAPVLISGTANQVNAMYRFSNVSSGVDAIVTIASATGGATVDIFDDNAISKPEGFSPKIAVPRLSTGLVTFNIAFVTAGTMQTNIQDSLNATAIDIDGNSNLKEIDVIDMGGGISSYQMGSPEITVTQQGSAFKGMNVAGNEYTSIDTAARQVMFTVIHNQVASFTYQCGAMNTSGSATSRQKSIYFKNFTYPASNTLPVKYASFDAVYVNHAVKLNWSTSIELNHHHFEVERSFDQHDFKMIGMVLDGVQAGAGKKDYQFKDDAAELKTKTIVYYRLKQVDLDGAGHFSKVIAIRMQDDQNMQLTVSPNPFMEQVQIRYQSNSTGKAEISMINLKGQTIVSKHSTISKGSNNIQLSGLTSIPSGMYIVQLKVGGVVVDNQQVIKN